MNCPNCGASNPEEAIFCIRCRAIIREVSQERGERNDILSEIAAEMGTHEVSREASRPLPTASAGARFMAFVLDLFILLGLIWLGSSITGTATSSDEEWRILMTTLSNLVKGIEHGDFFALLLPNKLILQGLLRNIIVLAYYVVLTAISGQTLGKMLMGIKVVRLDGEDVGWGRSIARYIFYWINGFIFYVGAFILLLNNERRTLHDFVAGTRVVRIRG